MADLLLVDNDRRIVDLAAWFLERRGFTVRSVLSYRDARVAIRERRPDLMLADLELGDESGREELPRLEREGLLPRTLVVSGFLDAALDAELRSIELVIDTLAKPYDMDRLEASIRACLAGGDADPRDGALGDTALRGEGTAPRGEDTTPRDGDTALRDVDLVPQAPPVVPPTDSHARVPSATHAMPPANDATHPSTAAGITDDEDDDWIEITPRSRPEAGA